MPDVEIKIFSAVITFIVICTLPALAAVLPNMLACIIKWKESVNVQMSSARVSRNVAAIGMVPVFVFICAINNLYPKTEGLGLPGSFVYTSVVFLAYGLVRYLCSSIFRSRKMEWEKFKCARSVAANFFIIASVIMSLTSLVNGFSGVISSLSVVLRLELAVVYIIYLIRKTQIFSYYGGFSSGILYLCTLEILPTSLLVASVWLL